MSGDVQSIVAMLRMNNCVSISIATVIAYDYVITFLREIKYIWQRPWTRVSTLFLVVRYVGFFIGVSEALYGSTFIPGPTLDRCTVLILVVNWAFVPFLAAVDLVMILRVYAMYQGSRIVLGVLLLFYIPMVVLLIVSTGFYNNPNVHLFVTSSRVLDVSFCSVSYTSLSRLNSYAFIPRFILAALMFIFAVVRLFIDLFQTYRATKQWMPNRYLNLLAKESVLYFLAHLFYNVDAAVIAAQPNNSGVAALAVDTLSCVSLFTLCPRLIISVRELYVRDSGHCWQGNSGIDTGFWLGEQQQSSMRFAHMAEASASDVGEDA